jgi:sulfoxide reductase heme-binding subunit YedZ
MKQRWLKPGVLAGALFPLAMMLWHAASGTLGADPVAIALNRLGLLALIFLWGSLLATPLKLVFALTWPIRIRKLLGLLAFFYASLHVSLYVVIDQGLDFAAIVEDVTQRRFITAGMLAFVLMIPLAVTSPSSMLKRMGAARWKRLHRLNYVIGLLAALHFTWRVKQDLTQPLIYATVLIIALALRALDRKRLEKSPRTT